MKMVLFGMYVSTESGMTNDWLQQKQIRSGLRKNIGYV